jgi:hypothetical protein
MDPKWWLRGGLVLVIVAFIVVLAMASILAFKPDPARRDRAEGAAVVKTVPHDDEKPAR